MKSLFPILVMLILFLACSATTYRNSTGIDGLEPLQAISAYPNPFTDQITLEDNDPYRKPEGMSDMIGRVLIRTIKIGSNFNINDPVLQLLSEGSYIFQVGDYMQKMVKNR